MLNEEKTSRELGYSEKSLSGGSSKDIFIVCDYCGKDLKTKKKYRVKANIILDKDACNDCKYTKRKELSLLQYGVENSAQRKDVRDVISKKSTFRDKDKIKAAMMSKYGVENPMESDKIKKRHKKSIRTKYGVDNVSQIDGNREKVNNTNLAKYGSKEYLASKAAREQIKLTCLEKYGVENVFQSKELMEKGKQTSLSRYGVSHHLKDKDRAKKHGEKVLKAKIKLGIVKLFNGKTISEIREEVGFSDSRFRVLINQHGFEAAVKMTPKVSYLETIIGEFLKENNIDFIPHQKFGKVISDIYIPDHNIVIETDGLYWHSEKEQQDKYYHMKKKYIYDNLFLKSLFFREDEIRDKLSIVKSIILNTCGKSRKIYARKCLIKELTPEESKTFFRENHLMGRGQGRTFALLYDNQIVSAIIVKGVKNGGHEISRFCNTLNTTVIGGFTRLLECARKICNISSITTFIDRRYGVGAYLETFGFTKEACYASFRWTDGTNSYHRLQFRGNSGYSKNLFKIWDCGQQKYVKKYSAES